VSKAIPNIAMPAQRLAEQLEQHLRYSGLRPGDKCLSTRQVAELFGVSAAMADQAIQVLVGDEKLIRMDRVGTFIGDKLYGKNDAPRLQTIFILFDTAHTGAWLPPVTALTAGLHAHNPEASIQFCFVPPEGDVNYVRDIIEAARVTNQLGGILAISCSRGVRQYLSREHVPTVILGTPDPDQQHLPSIDEDHFRASYLLTTSLIKRGRDNLALLAVGQGRPGDSDFHDGVLEAMAVAGLAANKLAVRAIPNDAEYFRLSCQVLFSQPDPPTGIICRRGDQATRIVIEVLQGLGMTPGKDCDIVFHTLGEPPADLLSYVHVRAVTPFEEVCRMAGNMLHQLRIGQRPDKTRVKLPVVLCTPSPERPRSASDTPASSTQAADNDLDSPAFD